MDARKKRGRLCVSHHKPGAAPNLHFLADLQAGRNPRPFRKCPQTFGRHQDCSQSILILWPEVGFSQPRGAAAFPSQALTVHQAHLGDPPEGRGRGTWSRPPLFVVGQVTTPAQISLVPPDTLLPPALPPGPPAHWDTPAKLDTLARLDIPALQDTMAHLGTPAHLDPRAHQDTYFVLPGLSPPPTWRQG